MTCLPCLGSGSTCQADGCVPLFAQALMLHARMPPLPHSEPLQLLHVYACHMPPRGIWVIFFFKWSLMLLSHLLSSLLSLKNQDMKVMYKFSSFLAVYFSFVQENLSNFLKYRVTVIRKQDFWFLTDYNIRIYASQRKFTRCVYFYLTVVLHINLHQLRISQCVCVTTSSHFGLFCREPKLRCRPSVRSSQEAWPFLELLPMKAQPCRGRALCCE